MRRFAWVVALGLVGSFSGEALAASSRCDGWVNKAATARGADLLGAYASLRKCDPEVARLEFSRFVKSATDLDTLTQLAIQGIDAESYNALWAAMQTVPYEHRSALAQGVGESCATHPGTLSFLQGAYIALRGNDFSSWAPALGTCADPALDGWLESLVVDPPKSSYNDKYNAILTAYIDLHHAAALPQLEKAAIAAAQAGPFTNILEQMTRAVQPKSFSDPIDPADATALADTLVRVAQQLEPETARQVADRLYTAGDEARAASLLPRVYPGLVQPDGGIMWAIAAIEQCDGKGTIHWATYTESPPTHWSVRDSITAPILASKPKNGCAQPWTVQVSDTPVLDAKAARTWAGELATTAAKDGDKIKLAEEKLAPAP